MLPIKLHHCLNNSIDFPVDYVGCAAPGLIITVFLLCCTMQVIIASKDRTRHAELAAAAASAAHAATVANQEKELAWSAVRVAALQQVADKQRIAADQTIILELRAAQSLYITCTQVRLVIVLQSIRLSKVSLQASDNF